MNHRIGDFLKELHLTEGKGTGIPKIRRAMKNNGSQEPVFETDDARSYFLTVLPTKEPEEKEETYPAVSGVKPAENRRISADTTPQEKKVLIHIVQNTSITSKQVEELLSIKTSRAKELLSKMVEKNLIEKRGQARSTHYILGEADD